MRRDIFRLRYNAAKLESNARSVGYGWSIYLRTRLEIMFIALDQDWGVVGSRSQRGMQISLQKQSEYTNQ